MLHRIGLGAETVVITGTSGGVGSAAVQLAKRRGAEVLAVAGAAKTEAVAALGADQVIERNAGLVAELDVRTLYLKDLTLMGCTNQEPVVFENLIRYIEADEIKPLVAGTYPLAEIVAAQQRFLTKDFVGKLVLIP